MKPQPMRNAMRHLALVLLMAPTMVLAQQRVPASCASSAMADAVAVHIPDVQVTPMSSTVRVQVGQVQPDPECQPDPELDAADFQSEKVKTFEKTYKVNKSDVLSIDNRFGKVHVNTWNRNEVHVKVTMAVWASSDERAQQMLDKIRVMETSGGGSIALKTAMESMNVSSSNNAKSLEINYTVSMPESNGLSIRNQFGDVYLANMKGHVALDVKHGSLKAERLTNTSNTVKIAHCSGNTSSISFLNKGSVDVSYSDINIMGANNIQGFTKYSSVNVGNITDVLNLETKYGDLRIAGVGKNIKTLNLASAYTDINMAFEDNSAFNFDVSVKYADFKFNKDKTTVRSLERSHTSAEYKGNYGSTTPKGTVSIVSRYGDVRFAK